jgi:ribosomal protein L16 Arg81 hydroxylase
LAPFDPEQFVDEYLGEKPLFIEGTANRWAHLFNWDDLNFLLEYSQLGFPQLHLMERGAAVEPRSYTTRIDGRDRINPAGILRALDGGATLVVNYGDRLVPKLREFTLQLESELQAGVHADIFAGFSDVPGLGPHWDHFECLNVQLCGAKQWTVYRPERLYPMRRTTAFPQRDDVETAVRPSESPTWTGTISSGDVLYIPRGWWHEVTPREVPSLHLGIAFDLPAGSDFLHWLADRLKREAFVRRNLPFRREQTEQRNFLATLRDIVSGYLTEETLEDYCRHLDDTCVERLYMGLPHSVAKAASPLPRDLRVCLRAPRRIDISVDDARGVLSFDYRGRPFEFPAILLPAISRLNQSAAHTVGDLCDGLPEDLIREALSTLVAAGVLSIANHTADGNSRNRRRQ